MSEFSALLDAYYELRQWVDKVHAAVEKGEAIDFDGTVYEPRSKHYSIYLDSKALGAVSKTKHARKAVEEATEKIAAAAMGGTYSYTIDCNGFLIEKDGD